MSRAFVNEDAGGWSGGGSSRFALPAREAAGFEEAAARALLQAHIEGDTGAAEAATGYYWGDAALRTVVARILDSARVQQDEELVRSAEKFLS
ncbi:MAG: hypothetical protein NVS1B4_23580 [Gemmatimonadaceae bacterium]